MNWRTRNRVSIILDQKMLSAGTLAKVEVEKTSLATQFDHGLKCKWLKAKQQKGRLIFNLLVSVISPANIKAPKGGNTTPQLQQGDKKSKKVSYAFARNLAIVSWTLLFWKLGGLTEPGAHRAWRYNLMATAWGLVIIWGLGEIHKPMDFTTKPQTLLIG